METPEHVSADTVRENQDCVERVKHGNKIYS